MSVTVYNSEFFERSSLWYVIFAGFFACFIILSLVYQNYIGALVLFLLLGGYLFFSISNTQAIKIRIEKSYLQIGGRSYPWSKVSGFLLEVVDQDHEIRNIILIVDGKNYIHTFKDTKQNVKNFILELSERAPILSTMQQSSLEKVTRALKL